MMRNGPSRLKHFLFAHLSGCVWRGILHGVVTDKVGRFCRMCISGVLTIEGL